MDKRNPGTSSARACRLVDQALPLGLEVSKSRVDVGYGVGDVMHTLPVPGQEPSHRRVIAQRLKQLHEGTAHRDHRFLDPLRLHRFAVQRRDPVLTLVFGERLVEVVHRDAHMIDVDQFHRSEPSEVMAVRTRTATARLPRSPKTKWRTLDSGDQEDMMPTSVIVGMARTPIGRFNGALKPLRAVELGGLAISAALARAGVDATQIDEVHFGQVLQAGEGQITARQAAVRAGVPMTTPSTTINKVCLSGTAAIAMADRAIRLGEASFVVAGGMESMTNAPYVVPNARHGGRMGDMVMIDVLQHDGLYCAFDQCTMGESSDLKNRQLDISREAQDAWAAESHRRAAEAIESGFFAREITAVEVPQRRRGEPILVDTDEGVRPDATTETLGKLPPAFADDGTITAGNASQISDGAGAVIIAARDAAEAAGLPVLGEIIAYGQIAGPDPTLHERPAEAIKLALKKAGMAPTDLDTIEINEAFASVAIHSTELLGVDPERVNPNGGAVALGHPIGASGARLVMTALNELQRRGGGVGVAAACGGGGQGDALIVRVDG